MNVSNWKKVAQNTDSWKKVVEQARTLYKLHRFIRRTVKFAHYNIGRAFVGSLLNFICTDIVQCYKYY